MEDGWIKLHRGLLDKAIWRCSTSEQKVIFITLLCMASHKDNQWIWQGKKFILKPGQFITSLKSLIKKTGCSSQVIRTSLVKFENLEFLTNESTKTGRLITITNWSSYQLPKNPTNKATNKDLTKSQQRSNNYQECKECKNKYSIDFLEFYSAYPLKKSKSKAFESWKKLKPDLTVCLSAIQSQIIEKAFLKAEKKFCPEWKHPSTWLNQQCWEDEVQTNQKKILTGKEALEWDG